MSFRSCQKKQRLISISIVSQTLPTRQLLPLATAGESPAFQWKTGQDARPPHKSLSPLYPLYNFHGPFARRTIYIHVCYKRTISLFTLPISSPFSARRRVKSLAPIPVPLMSTIKNLVCTVFT